METESKTLPESQRQRYVAEKPETESETLPESRGQTETKPKNRFGDTSEDRHGEQNRRGKWPLNNSLNKENVLMFHLHASFVFSINTYTKEATVPSYLVHPAITVMVDLALNINSLSSYFEHLRAQPF